MRICVVFNPTARGEKARRFRRHLDSIASSCGLKATSSAGAARSLAAEAVREGYDTIVAAGGDGTLNEALNGIGDEPDAFRNVRLGVLPLGTVNVFARELGIPIDVVRAWEIVRAGREIVIDLPQAEFTNGGRRERRYFAQLAGAGLDARAIESVDWELKKRIGPLSYVVAGLKAMKGEQSQILVSGGKETAAGELVLVGNGRFYGGPFVLFPQADLRDGLLDVSVFSQVRWRDLAVRGWGLVTQQLSGQAGVRNFQAESLILTSSSSVPFQVDGENVGHLPASFSLRKSILRVIVP